MKHVLKIGLFACICALLTSSISALAELSTVAAFETAINKHELVIIDFYMPLCGPCKQIAPILEELSHQLTNVRILKVDVTKEEFENVTRKYSIKSVPCLVFFKNGIEIGRHKGGNVSKEELEDKIKSIFNI